MTPTDVDRFTAALAGCAEVLQEPMSTTRLHGYFLALQDLTVEEVERACARAMREWRSGQGRGNFPKPAELRDLLQAEDGHPGPEEAWTLVAHLKEGETVVWTDPIAWAWLVAAEVMPDRVAARLAFVEVYRREVAAARGRGGSARWWASLGWEVAGRAAPVLEAVRLGRLTEDRVRHLLPLEAHGAPSGIPALPAGRLTDGPSVEDVHALVETLAGQRVLPAGRSEFF